jgi:hypothetical protein
MTQVWRFLVSTLTPKFDERTGPSIDVENKNNKNRHW